jgi:hypothetical protein
VKNLPKASDLILWKWNSIESYSVGVECEGINSCSSLCVAEGPLQRTGRQPGRGVQSIQRVEGQGVSSTAGSSKDPILKPGLTFLFSSAKLPTT